MELVYNDLVLASHIGLNGNLFGGELMSWIDKACVIFLQKKLKTVDIVTKRFDNFEFNSKVKQGDVVKIYIELTNIGRTSATVNISARKTQIIDSNYEEIEVTSSSGVFVHINTDTGEPKEIRKEIKKELGF